MNGFGSTFQGVDFILNSPPDFRNLSQVEDYDRLWGQVFAIPGHYGKLAKNVGFDYLINGMNPKPDFRFNRTIPELYDFHFLYGLWKGDTGGIKEYIHYNCDPAIVDNPGLLMKKLKMNSAFKQASTFQGRVEVVRQLRRIAADFSQFNVTIWAGEVSAVEFEGFLAPTMVQTIGFGFIAITLITSGMMCLEFLHFSRAKLLIAMARATLVLSTVLLSMQLGVIGILQYWGIDIDIVFIVCVLMSIGVSVDLTAHVSHKYEHSYGESVEDRIRDTILSVGWPILQAAVSTVMGVIVMALVPSYIVRVFWRSVVVAVLAGLYHGLLVMPLVYSALDFPGLEQRVAAWLKR